MNASIARQIALLAALAATFSATAADDVRSRPSLEPAVTNLNRLGLSYRMGFNIWADVRGLGGYKPLQPLSNPLRTPNGDPYNFDNGYMYADATTANSHPGFTWYYGYVSGSRVGSGSFDLVRSSSPSIGSSRSNEGDPQHSLELTYNRQLGFVNNGAWGVEFAAGYTDLQIQDSRSLRASVIRSTQTFDAGEGAVLKPVPFTGTVSGPAANDPNGWPLVGMSPAATSLQVFPNAASITGYRDFEAQLYDLRFGPYLDLPINNRFLFTLSGGMLLLLVHSDFNWEETVSLDPSVTVVALPARHSSGSDTTDKLLYGGYLSGMLSYALNERWHVFGGATFQASQNFFQQAAGKSINLELGKSVFISFGLSYSF